MNLLSTLTALAFLTTIVAAAPAALTQAMPAGLDPATKLAHYGVDFWGEPEGLMQSRIRAIVQTRDGYLWLGTASGLVRFDGASFTTYNVRNKKLRDNEVQTLLVDREDVLWIGTFGGGLTRYQNGNFTTFTTADGLPDDTIRRLDDDPEGNLWIATPRGLCRYGKGTFTTFTTKDGLANDFITAICTCSDQGIFAGAGNRLHRLSGGRFSALPGIVTESDGRLDHITAFRDGAVWMSFENAVVKRWKDGKLTTYTRANNLGTRTSVLYEDPRGTIWAGSRDGLRRLGQDGNFERFTQPGLKSDLGMVLSLCTDREGSLWVGTESDGLARLRNTPLTTLTAADGLPDSSTRTLFKDSRGVIWIGTASGFARYEGNRLTSITQVNGSHIPTVTSIGEDKDGTLWIGAGGQLLKMQNGRLLKDPSWARVFDIKVIYRDRRDRMWVGTDGDGLFEFENGRQTVYRMANGLTSNQIRSLCCDRRGALWIGTSGGLNRLADGAITTFTTRNGLSNNHVFSIREDEEDSLWIGTREGLCHFQNGQFKTIRSSQGLFSDYIISIQDDGRGNYWMTCDQGLFRVAQEDLKKVLQGKTRQINSKSFGVRDGMNTSVFGAGTQPTTCRTDDGRLLFCSLKGVVVMDHNTSSVNTLVPPVYLERVIVNKKDLALGGKAVLPPGSREVEFRYTALSFMAPRKVHFKYQLEGWDPEWVDAWSRRVVTYANLPAGDYRFRVIASNNDGVWNEVGASFAFCITPHFYQTSWFNLVCGLLTLLSAIFVHQIRIRRVVARETELKHRVDEAVAKIKVLSGMLPLCASCKKVRDDKGYWNSIEQYLTDHSNTEISHGICPDCVKKLYPELSDQILAKRNA